VNGTRGNERPLTCKKMLLVQSQSYRQQYGYNSIFLLPVTCTSPRQLPSDSSHVIPRSSRNALKRDRGDNSSRRGATFADARVSLCERRAEGFVLPRSATTRASRQLGKRV